MGLSSCDINANYRRASAQEAQRNRTKLDRCPSSARGPSPQLGTMTMAFDFSPARTLHTGTQPYAVRTHPPGVHHSFSWTPHRPVTHRPYIPRQSLVLLHLITLAHSSLRRLGLLAKTDTSEHVLSVSSKLCRNYQATVTVDYSPQSPRILE